MRDGLGVVVRMGADSLNEALAHRNAAMWQATVELLTPPVDNWYAENQDGSEDDDAYVET